MKLVKKIRIYPNKTQFNTFEFWLRRCKTLYNAALEQRILCYKSTQKSMSIYDQKKEIVDIKDSDSSWKGVPNKCLSNTLFQLDQSFKNFFKRNCNGFPKFKNSDTFKSIEFVKTDVRIKNNLIYLPKIKSGFKTNETMPNNYSSIRLKKECGKYFLCFIYGIPTKQKSNNTKNIIGIDLGLKTLMTDSNGNKINRFSLKLIDKYSKRINKLNESFSKKKKGSNRKNKIKKQLNKAYNRLKNTRLDYLHKETTKFIKNCNSDVIVMGDLQVKDLMKNNKTNKQKNFSRSYSNAAIGITKQQMKYKAEKNGKHFHLIGEHYTSKACSCCGNINNNLKVKDRIYVCVNKKCKLIIDRDENAAINIKNAWLGQFMPKYKFVQQNAEYLNVT